MGRRQLTLLTFDEDPAVKTLLRYYPAVLNLRGDVTPALKPSGDARTWMFRGEPCCLANRNFVQIKTNESIFHHLTIHIINLEEESQLVHLIPMYEQAQGFQQLLQTNGPTPICIKQREEPLGEEGLQGGGQMLSHDGGMLSTDQNLMLQTKLSQPAMGIAWQKLKVVGKA